MSDIREQTRWAFRPMLRQLAETFKAEVAAKRFDIPLSLDLAAMLEGAFERQFTAFYSAAHREGYERGRQDGDRRYNELLRDLDTPSTPSPRSAEEGGGG